MISQILTESACASPVNITKEADAKQNFLLTRLQTARQKTLHTDFSNLKGRFTQLESHFKLIPTAWELDPLPLTSYFNELSILLKIKEPFEIKEILKQLKTIKENLKKLKEDFVKEHAPSSNAECFEALTVQRDYENLFEKKKENTAYLKNLAKTHKVWPFTKVCKTPEERQAFFTELEKKVSAKLEYYPAGFFLNLGTSCIRHPQFITVSKIEELFSKFTFGFSQDIVVDAFREMSSLQRKVHEIHKTFIRLSYEPNEKVKDAYRLLQNKRTGQRSSQEDKTAVLTAIDKALKRTKRAYLTVHRADAPHNG